MPVFPARLEENPPRDGFFEHEEYLKVRAQAPTSYQDVLAFVYAGGSNDDTGRERAIGCGLRAASPGRLAHSGSRRCV